ncbi:uncharacterized protein AB675_2088 [Cyphellophora attinorum]|uniref:Uncharacterized protein n=1 Tax=Cyphellophora attinorum TaxID=1664694 RepID=A0A0N1HY34_9EURO|nr:uncharacterized protein AB675_2088 [Phialophora attinorum]KPI43145.1 hypothetical protein AB675_2088 [Phialophora attinorum]
MQLTHLLFTLTTILLVAAATPLPVDGTIAVAGPVAAALAVREAAPAPEPIRKGHFGKADSSDSGEDKRNAMPEPIGKGHLGKDAGGAGAKKRDALPEPIGKGHLGKDGKDSSE